MPNGELKEGTFPVFDSPFSVLLVEEVYLENDNTHFLIANETLYQAIQESPNMKNDLGGIPIWIYSHHNEQLGVLQHVSEETHQNTGYCILSENKGIFIVI